MRPLGQSTGVYTTLPGQNAQIHCTVTADRVEMATFPVFNWIRSVVVEINVAVNVFSGLSKCRWLEAGDVLYF